MVTAPLRTPTWVGWNVTLMRQLAPAATVAPQDLATIFCAKSPLTTILLMFSVDDPELVRVTVLAPLFTPTKIFPHLSEVGERVTTEPLPVTVKLKVVVELKLPHVPMTVTVEVPRVAPAFAV